VSTPHSDDTPSAERTSSGPDGDGTSGNGIAAFLRARPRARKTLLRLAAADAVVGAVAWWYLSGRVSTDDAQVDGHVTPIAARVGGTVLEVFVEDNQRVALDEVLVRLDPTDYEVAVARSEADLAAAEAALAAARFSVPITSTTTTSRVNAADAGVARAHAGAEGAAARLEAAEARLREAKANSTRYARDLERMRELVAKDEVAQQQVDSAEAAAIAADATVDAASSAIREAGHALEQARNMIIEADAELEAARTAPGQVAVTRSQAEAAAARLEQAQAALRQARLNLSYATVRAPSAGVVSKKSAEPGQIVGPGQPLLALVDTDDIWVTANFKETQLRHVRPGQQVSVKVDAYGRRYSGRVESIAAATGARFSLLPPENASGNYVKVVQRVPVKIVLDEGQDPEHLLFVPLTTITMDPIPNHEMGNAASLYNLMRNIGGGVGIALIQTFIVRQRQLHTTRLGEHITVYEEGTRLMLERLQAVFMQAGADASTALDRATAAVWGMVQKQAAVLAYLEAFHALGLVVAIIAPLAILMRRPRQAGRGAPAASPPKT
jgi:membrane fusion protein (multidrug efflux system)